MYKRAIYILIIILGIVVAFFAALFLSYSIAEKRSVAKEEITKETLKSLRNAILTYKKEWGIYPRSLTRQTPIKFKGKLYPPFCKYIPSIPPVFLRFGIEERREGKIVKWFDNGGGFVYNPDIGELRINKWAFDTKGKIYYFY